MREQEQQPASVSAPFVEVRSAMPHKAAVACALLMGLAAGAPAHAASFDENKMIKAVETLRETYRIVNVCMYLQPHTDEIILDGWKNEVRKGADWLNVEKASKLFALRYIEAVDPRKLQPGDMSLAAARSLCEKNPTLVQDYLAFALPTMPDVMQKVKDGK